MIPPLAEPYRTALDQAIVYIRESYEPLGIVASGTIVRGVPDASSDLDLVVCHEPPWRQRIQRRFTGVPTEIFVNPEFQLHRQMGQDTRAGRPVMAHMLATGAIVHDTGGIMTALQDRAIAVLDAGPEVPSEHLVWKRYGITTAFEDAVDLQNSDPDRAHTIVTEALIDAVKLHFLQYGRWLPRSKALLTDLDALDPALGQATRAALGAARLDERLELAAPLILRIAGATGFFAWEGEPQPLEPPS